MTLSDLKANVKIMQAGNLNFLIDPTTGTTYTETDLQAKYREEALEILEHDLKVALNVDQENTTDIDETVDLNQEELAKALSYLQLHLIYLDLDNGEGSQSRFRAIYYEKKYREYKDRFPHINKRSAGRSYEITGAIQIG